MSPKLDNPTVLIVDDEPVIRNLIRTAVSNLDCEVLDEVANGETAVFQYQKLRPDITFLDIDMPRRDGLEALRLLLAIDPGAFIVIVSAHSTFDNVQRAIDCGAKGFIVKPFNASKFKMLVDKFREESAPA